MSRFTVQRSPLVFSYTQSTYRFTCMIISLWKELFSVDLPHLCVDSRLVLPPAPVSPARQSDQGGAGLVELRQLQEGDSRTSTVSLARVRASLEQPSTKHAQANFLGAIDFLLFAGAPLDHRHHRHVQLADKVGPSLTLRLIVTILPPTGHRQVDRWTEDKVSWREAGWPNFVPKLDASCPSLPLDVDDGNVVVEVRSDPKLLMEVNFLNVKLLLLLIRDLDDIVADPDIVDASGVPVVPEAVGCGQEVERRDDHRPTVVEGPAYIFMSSRAHFLQWASKLPISRTPQSDACLPRKSSVIHLEPRISFVADFLSPKMPLMRIYLTLIPPAILGVAAPGMSDTFLQRPHCSTIYKHSNGEM